MSDSNGTHGIPTDIPTDSKGLLRIPTDPSGFQREKLQLYDPILYNPTLVLPEGLCLTAVLVKSVLLGA